MRTLIIDHNVLFTEGIRCLLDSFGLDNDTLHVDDTQAAIELISEKGRPDLTFLDVNQFEDNGYHLIQKLHEITDFSPVIVISEIDSKSLEQSALSAGASAFISKACNKKTLFEAIKIVLNGGVYENQRKDKPIHEINVTKRQSEILSLLSEGLLNKQIAGELSISINTVNAHLHEIFRKLNVTNRTAAVQYAHKYGLI